MRGGGGAAGEPQGHDASPTCGSPRRCWRAPDADRLPRPPAPRRRGHRRRSATSPPANAERYREAAAERGHRRARRGRARPPLRPVRSTSGSTPGGATAVDDLDEYCEFVRAQTDLRLGIEADFVPGARGPHGEPARRARRGTTCVGSVHFLRDDAVDMPASRLGRVDIWRGGDPEKVWSRYFETLGEAARSGLFDILAHPDLVKVWGDGRAGAGAATCAASTSSRWTGSRSPDVAIEVSTAGLRKPVGEIYPARRVPGDVPRGGPPGRAVERRARARAARATSTSARWSGWASSGSRSWPCSSGRERRLEPLG